MASLVQYALRISQFIWTLLTLSLIGSVIAGAFAGNDSAINYAMFVSVFSMLVVIWGFLAAWNDSFTVGPFLVIADGLATLFTFIAGVVLAARLHVHSCGNKVSGSFGNRRHIKANIQQSYVRSNALTNGSHNPSKRCHELQASTAFYWFAFASFAASVAIGVMSGGSSLRGGRGGIRKGGPSMSQV